MGRRGRRRKTQWVSGGYSASPYTQEVDMDYGAGASVFGQTRTPISYQQIKKPGDPWKTVGGAVYGAKQTPGQITTWFDDAPGAEGATAPVTWPRPGQSPAASQAVYDPQAAATPNPASTSAWTPAPAANPQGQLLTGTSTTQPQQMSYTAPMPTPQTAGHPFFDPNSNYQVEGWPNARFDPNSLAFMNWATNESPEGYYFGLLNQLGLGGIDARSQAAQSMYGDFARGYQAAKARNIELWFPQFMQMQNIPWLIDQLSNEQLGMDTGAYEGRDRWALRGY